jgi:hypothetical protein
MPSRGLLTVNTHIVSTDKVLGVKEWGRGCSSQVGMKNEYAGILHGTHREKEERVTMVIKI